MKKIIFLTVILSSFFVKAQTDTTSAILCRTVHLDGIDDYLSTDTSSAYNVNTFTIEFWVKIDSFTNTFTFFPSTLSKEKGSRFCWYKDSTHTLDVGIYTGVFKDASISYELDTSRWYHFAYTFDEDTTIRLYIDGDLVIEEKFSDNNIYSDSTVMLIGARPMNLSVVTAAQFDEVRFWNYARSHEQIREFMNIPVNNDVPGLIGYWKMNDLNSSFATDWSPTHNNALLQNANSNSVWENHCSENPILCKTVHLDGVDDYLSTDTSSAYNVNTFTIEFWVKIDSFTNTFTFFPSTLSKEKGSRFCWYKDSTHTLDVGIYTGVFKNASVSYELDTNRWYHFAYTFDEDTTIRLYIDGDLVIEEKFNDNNIYSDSTVVLIGARPIDLSVVTAAQFDEVRFWNYARSLEEINFAENLSLNPKTPGLIGYWQINDSNVTFAEDVSIVNNPAVLVNCDVNAVWQNNCSQTPVQEVSFNSGCSVFPNPVSDYLNLEMSEDKINNISIYDFTGKLVKNLCVNNNKCVLNVSELESGVYVLKIKSDDKVMIYKIIKK